MFCRGEIAGLDEVGDTCHLLMKCGVLVQDGAVFRRVAEVLRVFREQPFADGTLFRVMDGTSGAFGKRLADRDGQQERDLPAHVAGDRVSRRLDRLGDIWDGRQGRTFG